MEVAAGHKLLDEILLKPSERTSEVGGQLDPQRLYVRRRGGSSGTDLSSGSEQSAHQACGGTKDRKPRAAERFEKK